MYTEEEWKNAVKFIHKVCPTQSGRSNPTQRMTDENLFQLYKKNVNQAKGKTFLENVKKSLGVIKSSWDNFSCKHCMDLETIKIQLQTPGQIRITCTYLLRSRSRRKRVFRRRNTQTREASGDFAASTGILFIIGRKSCTYRCDCDARFCEIQQHRGKTCSWPCFRRWMERKYETYEEMFRFFLSKYETNHSLRSEGLARTPFKSSLWKIHDYLAMVGYWTITFPYLDVPRLAWNISRRNQVIAF